MYDALVKKLRYCANAISCLHCPYWKGCGGSKEDLGQAADAIERLKCFNALWQEAAKNAHEREPKWIPVTERLPDEGKFVLVYGDLYPNKHDGSVISVSKRMDWNYWQGFGRERKITHWMPLPEPPKEET